MRYNTRKFINNPFKQSLMI